jgi:hypothetical protein
MPWRAISSLSIGPGASGCTSRKTQSSRCRENPARRQRSRSRSCAKTLWICPTSTDRLASHNAQRTKDSRRAAAQTAQARNAERNRRTGWLDFGGIHRPSLICVLLGCKRGEECQAIPGWRWYGCGRRRQGIARHTPCALLCSALTTPPSAKMRG